LDPVLAVPPTEEKKTIC